VLNGSAYLQAILATERLTAVVDIGANPIDGDPPYIEMLRSKMCTVTGFEPQPAALAVLERQKGPLETYLPYAVGDGRHHTLRLTAATGMASLFNPDTDRLDLFGGFAEWGRVVGEVTLATRRMDDIEDVAHLDMLKIDVQGAELMVFRGARKRLTDAVVVHTEVSFVPLYTDQPVFGEIDIELRGLGFIPHALASIKR
jgi:FkbM family methyltransferase